MPRDATSSEIAAALGIAPATVQKYARDGRIPFDKTPGGHRRFDLGEVREALGIEVARGEPAGKVKPQATAVILTALPLEFDAVVGHLPHREVRTSRGRTRYHVGRFDGDGVSWAIAVGEIGAGNLGAAVTTSEAVREFDPDLLLFVGVAGALKPELAHGTVVVADRVYLYESGKAEEDFRQRPIGFPTLYSLSQLVREVRRTEWANLDELPEVEIGPIAAGEKVLADSESHVVVMLRQRFNDALAVDMESAGVYEAAQRSDIPVLAVRGISDKVDDKSPERDSDWQPVAARNAAAFAFALLATADSEDLRRAPVPTPQVSQRDDLLAHVPAPVAAAIERALERDEHSALQLLRHLTNEDREPHELVRELVLEGESRLTSGVAELWLAVAEFASAHRCHSEASLAFARAADIDQDSAPRWLARAALASAASGSDGAEELLTRARMSAGPQDEAFIAVIEAAIAEDAKRVLEFAESHGPGHGLIDLMRVRALAELGRLDEALEVAFGALKEHPGASLSGGTALQAARLFIRRCELGGAPPSRLTDLERARELALKARDERRRWRGPSDEAALVAAQAAAAAKDFDGVIRIALPPPDGEASARETTHPELVILAANAALALDRPEFARHLASEISDEGERLLVEASCAQREGHPDEAVELNRAALDKVHDADRLFRALAQLADLGVLVADAVDRLESEDVEAAELVRASYEITTGKEEAGLRRLRKHQSLRSVAFAVEAHRQLGYIDEAVDLLLDGSERYDRPELQLWSVELLAAHGRYGDALEQATSALALIPTGTYLHSELRRWCVELAARAQVWTEMANHAKAAISEGIGDEGVEWALIGSLFNLRRLDEAREELVRSRPRPRRPEEAGLAIELWSSGSPDTEAVAEILKIADQFPGSEDVNAAAFGAVMQLSADLELPATLVERIRELSESFFERWPESRLVERIDASDPDLLIQHLRERLAPAARRHEDIVRDVQLARTPYSLLAVSRGRSLAEALITGGAGCIPIGTLDPVEAERELEVARASLDSDVVADSHALYVAGLTGLADELIASFRRGRVERSVLDDAIAGARALRLRSTMTLGWDPRADRPTLAEISPEQAEEWSRQADELIERSRHLSIRELGEPADPDSLSAHLALASFHLARAERIPLWTDDPAIRKLTRNEGGDAFGTVALLQVLEERDLITSEMKVQALTNLMKARVVDIPFSWDMLTNVTADCGWNSISALLPLTRPGLWREPAKAFELYRTCLKSAAAEDEAYATDWCYAAATGAARVAQQAKRCDAVATAAISGLMALDAEPRALPRLLSGARAAANQLDLDDPWQLIVTILYESFLEEVEPSQAASLVMKIVSVVEPADRATAVETLLS